MKGTQFNNFILVNVKSRISDKNAITTHGVIAQTSRGERCKIFNESAGHYINKKWDCSAIKTLMK